MGTKFPAVYQIDSSINNKDVIILTGWFKNVKNASFFELTGISEGLKATNEYQFYSRIINTNNRNSMYAINNELKSDEQIVFKVKYPMLINVTDVFGHYANELLNNENLLGVILEKFKNSHFEETTQLINITDVFKIFLTQTKELLELRNLAAIRGLTR